MTKMHVITIHASLPQIRRLRKGHKVRVKKGKGVHIIVKPETYNLTERTFNKNKGIDLQLDDEEIAHNAYLSPEQHEELRKIHSTGGGIFGKWGDRMLEKAGVKDMAYQLGDVLKPHAKKLVLGGLTAGATALGAMQPELIPFLAPGVGMASSMANEYLDHPGKYQPHEDESPVEHYKNLAKSEAKSHANKLINQHLGTNYDYMNTAGLQEAGANELAKQITKHQVEARKNLPTASGDGIHKHRRIALSGGALHHHAHRQKNLMENHTIGTNGNFVQWTPPALVSQPYSANFAMSHMLPPQYAHLNNSVVGHELLHGSGMSGCGPRHNNMYDNEEPVLNNGRKKPFGIMGHGKMGYGMMGHGMKKRGYGLGP